jgi:predicted RNase H-like nuclease (RuvC/YqgF family)
MANEQQLISGIEYKVRKLIEFNDELNKENTELHQKIDALNSNVAVLTKELEVKRNELFKISLAHTIESDIGVEEGKERLDSLIEEIDKCIEVMSD